MEFSQDLFVLPTVGGAKPFELKTIEQVKEQDKSEDLLTTPILIIKEVEESNNTSSVAGKYDDLSELPQNQVILAANGAAVLAAMEHLNIAHPMREKLFKLPEDRMLTSIDEVLPEQKIFLGLFHTIFFLGVGLGGIFETLESSFEERFLIVSAALESGAGDRDRKIFGFPDLKLKEYFEQLTLKYKPKKTVTYDEMRGILVSRDPQRVLRWFMQPSAASTIRNRGTVAQWQNVNESSVENNASSVRELGENEEENEPREPSIAGPGAPRPSAPGGPLPAAPSAPGGPRPSAPGGPLPPAPRPSAPGGPLPAAPRPSAPSAPGGPLPAAPAAPRPPTGRNQQNSLQNLNQYTRKRWKQAIRNARGRNITRKNKNNKSLKIGDYVEFRPSTNRPTAAARRGIVALPSTQREKVIIGELNPGSTTEFKSGQGAWEVSSSRIQKPETLEPIVEHNEGENENNNASSVGSRIA